MANIMIYHTLDDDLDGRVENVWGFQMLTKIINSDGVEQAKQQGWHNHPQKVIDEINAIKMQAENKFLKGKIDVERLQIENQSLKAEIEQLKSKLAIYQNAQDGNKDGKVSFDEMTNDQLKAYLDSKGVKYGRANKDALLRLANETML